MKRQVVIKDEPVHALSILHEKGEEYYTSIYNVGKKEGDGRDGGKESVLKTA